MTPLECHYYLVHIYIHFIGNFNSSCVRSCKQVDILTVDRVGLLCLNVTPHYMVQDNATFNLAFPTTRHVLIEVTKMTENCHSCCSVIHKFIKDINSLRRVNALSVPQHTFHYTSWSKGREGVVLQLGGWARG
jgi:hypothetical protein